MTILITGADGVIGKELSGLLIKSKFDTILHTRRKSKKNLKNYFFCSDLSKKINLKKKPITIIHCAGTNKDSFRLNKKSKFKKNLRITKNLIHFSNQYDVKNFIFLSSIDVYGKKKKVDISENFTGESINFYGKAKLASEKALCNKSNKFTAICLRLPGILTKSQTNQKPHLRQIIDKMKKKKIIEIYNPDSLFNNVMDVQEIFKIIKILIKRKINKSNIYNLSASQPLKFLKIIKIIKNKTKYKKKIIIKDTKEKSFTISNIKLKKTYGINISTTEKIIKRFLNTSLI